MTRAVALALVLAAGAALVSLAHGARHAALALVGAGLGVVLFHASFGFAGGFRRLLGERRGAGFRAQLLLIGLTAAAFLPLLAMGSVFGQPVRGFVFPVGWALLLGAFLFGVGMQVGGGCASGTLYAAGGGGAPRMWITLAAFVAGATLAAWDAERWSGWDALPAVSLPARLGTPAALGLTLGVLALLWFGSVALERRRHGAAEPLAWTAGGGGWRRVLAGPWPAARGAVALAGLGVATLLLAGRPWGITSAFPLWGSRVVESLGWDDPAFWTYWEDPTRAEALLRPVLSDRTTVMDLALMLGAALAAAMAGRAAGWRVPRAGEMAASVLGGLLLGIGAVLATGCNISAFLGGIASGSLHGWAWIGPALAGNAVGLRLRPMFGLARPVTPAAMR